MLLSFRSKSTTILKIAFVSLIVLSFFCIPQIKVNAAIPYATDFVYPMKTWQRNGLKFMASWSYNKCSICRVYYRHVGEDVNVGRYNAGKPVYSTEAGVVKLIGYDNTWKYCIVIEHTLKNGSKVTSVYWHLNKPVVKNGQVVKRGQYIGTLANLGNNTHLHFGIRLGSFDKTLSMKGALPGCSHKPNGLPKAPEKFVDPTNWIKNH